MAPRYKKEVVIFVLNVGTSNLVFLQKAKHTIIRLIEKKIFLRPKDEIGLIVMGSKETKNEYDVNNIEVFDVVVPNWNLIRNVMDMSCTDRTVSWVDTLYIAFNYMEQECVDASTKRIILFSDMMGTSNIKSHFGLKKTAALLKEKHIGFMCVGDENLDPMSSEPSSANLEVLQDFCKQVDGVYLSINSVVDDVKIFKRPPPNPTAWKCCIDLYGIKIPIAAYIKVTRETKLPSWKLVTMEQPGLLEKIERCTELLDRHRTERTADEVVSGYIYGDKPVPVLDEDKNVRSYKSGPESYRIHSFVEKSKIGIENWHGLGTRIIVPGDDSAATLFYAMMRAMISKNLVALVRKVRRRDSTPKIVALYPRADVPEEPRCFIEIELPFSENRNAIEPKPMKSVRRHLTKEQDEAVDDLLTSLALDEDDTIDGTSFLPGCVTNPAIQHSWHALVARAIAPDDPVPPMDDSLQALLKRPEYIRTKSEKHLDRVKRAFNLSPPESTAKKSYY